MFIFLCVLFCINAFIILWTMIEYPLFLLFISKVRKMEGINKDISYEPTVSIMVVAHNEEKVIVDKLNNLIQIDYPTDKYNIIVTSDNSTDKTNEFVEEFIKSHPFNSIKLYVTKEHKGKTNAQNEAQKLISSEILIMTDANCMFEKNAVRELVTVFSDNQIAYVCGRTVFINSSSNETAASESDYWDYDSKIRNIESQIQTITAGDGNIYACRNSLYKDIPLIECHDGSFPIIFALEHYRAVFEPNAVAYEKSGESIQDEYKRKVRMNRNIIHNILPSYKILNVFQYKWFSFFYISHRSFRYSLWFAHLLVLLTNILLVFQTFNLFWLIILIGQLAFYLLATIGFVTKNSNRLLRMITYYSITVFSQLHGVVNIITGKAKPTWSKAESTR